MPVKFDETAEAIYPTSGYVYPSAAVAEQSFAGESDHFVYSRYGNPTVSMFEERLRLLERNARIQPRNRGIAPATAPRFRPLVRPGRK